jgi:hypothetical protein
MCIELGDELGSSPALSGHLKRFEAWYLDACRRTSLGAGRRTVTVVLRLNVSRARSQFCIDLQLACSGNRYALA